MSTRTEIDGEYINALDDAWNTYSKSVMEAKKKRMVELGGLGEKEKIVRGVLKR